MKELVLIRHAKSSWKEKLPDHERPLNERGERDAPEMGRRLAEAGAVPELIVTSNAVRARATATELARAMGLAADAIRFDSRLYEAGVKDLAALVAGLDDALTRVAFVGHNPTVQEAVACLCELRPEKLPTAAVVRIELPIDRWRDLSGGIGHCVGFDSPKEDSA